MASPARRMAPPARQIINLSRPAQTKLRGRPVPKLKGKRLEGTPRLWNAKRRIKTSIGTRFGTSPSPDVLEFIKRSKETYRPLLPHQEKALLDSPVHFFSRPHNVHPRLRKQIYLPNFVVTLRRTPSQPPKYATFDVPLWFNKLDIKDFLKSAYNVDIIHARSSVSNGRVRRERTSSPQGQGRLFRTQSRKKMTVQLVEPFIYPEEVKDLEAWEKDRYWEEKKAQYAQQRAESDWSRRNPNESHRKSIAEQARELLSGKATWSPTWQQIPADVRAMQGRNAPSP